MDTLWKRGQARIGDFMSILDWFRAEREDRWEPALVRRLVEIERRQDDQEKSLKTLDMEWSEWYDKFRHMYARLAKRIVEKERQDALGRTNGEDPLPQDPPPPPSPGEAPRSVFAPVQPQGYRTGRRNY